MEKTTVLGKLTKIQTLQSWKGSLVEVRQHDSIAGEQIILLDKELVLRLAKLFEEEN